jgi:hypothetical protein
MPLQESPKLEDFDEIIPESAPVPQSPAKGRRVFRSALAGLALLVLALVVLNNWQTNQPGILTGAGSIQGVVLNEKGLPPQDGYVRILGFDATATLAPDGSFKLNQVPAGTRQLVALDRYTGQEIIVSVASGQTTDIGTIQFQTTAVPEP